VRGRPAQEEEKGVATFGKFEVVTELHSGERGSVFSARAAGGGREIKYAVKTFNPQSLDLDEQFWESQSFTERARVQQRVAEANGSHWAPLYEIGTSPAGTYYVTNFHPLSAASLVSGRVDVGAGVLYSIVRSVVAGLDELKSTAGRAHGNLKAANVLVDSRGDVAVAGAVLTDPASAPDAAKSGEAGDLYALGELIHLLVLGRPFRGGGDWPLGPAREWARLGRQGRLWRRLCNDLLDPDPSSRPQGLEAVAKRLRRLVPRRARPSRRLSLAVAVAVVVIAAGAAALLGFRDAGARREVCAAKQKWAGTLTKALADPKRRGLLMSDPDLARVIHELDMADLASFDCDRAPGRFGFNPDLRKFRQTQDTLDAVRRAERGLSPIQWRQLARAAELQGRFEARGWTGPARHLAQCIAGARPGSGDLAAGIERFLVALKAIDDNLEGVEKQWVALQTQTRALEETRDPVMRAFAALLRASAASSVRLTDAGFGDLRGVADASGRAAELVTAHEKLGPQYDEERFNSEIVSDISKKIARGELQSVDIDHYLNAMAAYQVQGEAIRRAVEQLRQEAARNEKLVLDSGIDRKRVEELQAKLSSVYNFSIKSFAEEKFIERDIVDGTFESKRKRAAADVASIATYARMDDVQKWLEKLGGQALGVTSPALNQYWDEWRQGLAATAAQAAAHPAQVAVLQDETRRLHDVLMEIERQVAPPGKPLGDDELMAKAADTKREEVFASLLKNRLPAELARQADAVSKVKDAAPVVAARMDWEKWKHDLADFARDFPLRQRIVTPDVRPDEKWAKANPAFWNDRIIQLLVAPDLDRLKALRALADKPRDELVNVAQSQTREELALQAWRLLGTRADPAWPTREGELKAEAAVRARLAEMLAGLQQNDEGAHAAKELADEGPRRWTRFAESAGTDESMLASALELRGAFGVTPERFASLTPETRFNLALLDARRHMGDTGDAALSAAVTELTNAARELKDRTVADDLARRLARVGEKEPFAGAALGDEFTLQPTGTDARLVFRRVKQQGRRPFFLSITEVSVGQFMTVVNAASAWDDLRTLVWSPQPGEIGDPRRGPRSWEWVMRPAPRMYPPQWWLFPEDANDFPKELRDPAAGRFNRTVLSDTAGGTPSDRHPVQYVTPESAMFVASLVGCRLPTPEEWRAAFDAYEKAVPPAQWNLRDETWRVQRDHVAALGDAGPRGPQLPDDGIYLPPRPSGEPATVATGAAAKSLAQRDGTLYFRPTDAAGGSAFRQLVGNVAEIVCDAPEAFGQLKERSPQTIKAFAADAGTGLFVIGGSALSPPELPTDRPLPLKPGAAYADVGFRLAFTAPSRNLAERLEWALAGQGFVKPVADSKTASAVKASPGS
jgi:formylglycine-generating enzyme required for sulfatase activity